MASGKTTFALLGIFVFMILSISLVSATTIFEDDFDDYTTLSDNWTLTNEGSPNWTISNAYAEANGNSTTTPRIQSGYSSALFSLENPLSALAPVHFLWNIVCDDPSGHQLPLEQS